jgi:hypothetical protein
MCGRLAANLTNQRQVADDVCALIGSAEEVHLASRTDANQHAPTRSYRRLRCRKTPDISVHHRPSMIRNAGTCEVAA